MLMSKIMFIAVYEHYSQTTAMVVDGRFFSNQKLEKIDEHLKVRLLVCNYNDSRKGMISHKALNLNKTDCQNKYCNCSDICL